MGMTIDEAIKRFGDIRNNYDNWSGLGLTPNESEAFKLAIETMHKYQQIQEILKDDTYYEEYGNSAEKFIVSAINEVTVYGSN